MKLSVIATFYNSEKYVEACMDSLMKLDYADYEVIVIDDGSNDQTKVLLQSYIERHRLKFCFHNHQGVSAARNAGIELADGEYVMFVDGDDYLDQSILKELVQYAEQNADIIACTCTAFDEKDYRYSCHFFDGDRVFASPAEKEDLFAQLMHVPYGQEKYTAHTAIGVPWGKLYKRSFLLERSLHFDPKLIRMQDNIFNTQAFYYANKIIYIDKPLYQYRLAHIQSYQLKPELNYLVLESRAKFFTEHPEIFSDKLKQFFALECLNFLIKFVKLFALNYSYQEFKGNLETWINMPLCHKALSYPEVLPMKRRIPIFLIQHKYYQMLYGLLKYRKNNRKCV